MYSSATFPLRQMSRPWSMLLLDVWGGGGWRSKLDVCTSLFNILPSHIDGRQCRNLYHQIDSRKYTLAPRSFFVIMIKCWPSSSDSAPVADWDRIFSVNARGVFLCYQYAGRQMINQGRGGRIIGASSIAGKRGMPERFSLSQSSAF